MNPILVPVRNGLHLTKMAHASFLAQDLPVDVIYIDNASTNGTAEWLSSRPEAMRIRNSVPKGVTASWNQGLRWLFTHGAEHALVCNNDVELSRHFYRTLLDDGGGLVTGVSSDRPPEEVPDTPEGKRPHPDFSGFLIRKSVWDAVGEFDAGMVHYCSDGDYHLRCHQKGIDVYCLSLPFQHTRSSTLKMATAEEVAEIMHQAELDREFFTQKWGCPMGSQEYYGMFAVEGD